MQTSRLVTLLTGAAWVVAGLLPVGLMFGRIEVADLANLVPARTLELLGRTGLLGLSAAGIALLLGVPFGFLVARTDLPGASLLRPLGVVPLFLPPLMIAMTWSMLSDVRGAPAAIAVMGFSTFPLVSVFVSRACERIDARREEAARLVGGLPAVLRAEWRLVLPAALTGASVAFVFAVNDFSVPDYVSSVGPKFNVYADEIFATWQTTRHPGRAVAVALPLLALTLLSLVPALFLRRRGALTTLEGDFRRPPKLRLGAWRVPALLFCLAALALSAGVPLGRLLFEAGGGPRGWTGERFQAAFARALELARDDLRNSVVYAFAAATICLPVGLVLGHALERSGRRWLEVLVLVPLAVPALLFGIGQIGAWNHDATASFYDGPGMVILLHAGRYATFPILILAVAVAALDPNLEESARLAGVSPLRRLGRIVSPCLAPSLFGGWMLVFVLAMRELDATILVPAANHTAMFRVFNAVHFGRDDFVAALALLVVFLILLPGILWSLFARKRLEMLP